MSPNKMENREWNATGKDTDIHFWTQRVQARVSAPVCTRQPSSLWRFPLLASRMFSVWFCFYGLDSLTLLLEVSISFYLSLPQAIILFLHLSPPATQVSLLRAER